MRNVIYIVSEIGKDKYYWLVEKYFTYSDERVQHEMIRCVLKLGGPKMKPRLLEGLSLVQDRLKTYILRLLVEQSKMMKKWWQQCLLLHNRERPSLVNPSHELLQAIIAALKQCSAGKVLSCSKKCAMNTPT